MNDDPTARALALLSCLTSRAHWTGQELATRLGVTTRTVRRDVERLRRLGYRIDATSGVQGGYRLTSGASPAPLFLDADEAVALVTALLAATGDQATGMVDASLRALAKLHHLLPTRLVGAADAVRTAARSAQIGQAPAVDPHVIAVLAECCRDAAAVRFSYRRRDGEPSARRVEPNTLVTVRRVWYLVAFDLDRADWRTFRVDRIDGAVERTGHGAPSRALPTGDPMAFVAASLAEIPYEHTATLDVALPRDRLLSLARGLNPRRVDERGRRACRVRLGAAELDELVRQIVDIVAIGPVTVLDAAPAVLHATEQLADTLATAAKHG